MSIVCEIFRVFLDIILANVNRRGSTKKRLIRLDFICCVLKLAFVYTNWAYATYSAKYNIFSIFDTGEKMQLPIKLQSPMSAKNIILFMWGHLFHVNPINGIMWINISVLVPLRQLVNYIALSLHSTRTRQAYHLSHLYVYIEHRRIDVWLAHALTSN